MQKSLRKLTDSDIENIKLLRQQGESVAKISETYGVHWSTIYIWIGDEERRKNKMKFRPTTYNKSGSCDKCNTFIRGHRKCKRCGILLHEIDCDCHLPPRYSLRIRY